MFGWIKNIRDKVKDLSVSVDTYKKETENQAIPSLAYVNRAKKLIEKKQFAEAKEILVQALAITEKDALVYKYIGVCEERMGNYSAAIVSYKKSSGLNPQDKKIWHQLGIAQVTIRDYEEAEKSFEQANKITPLNTDVQTGWGMSLMKQKKYSEALEKFTKAVKINRYNFSALLLAAIAEIRLEKYDDARTKLEFLSNANPTEGCMYEYANLCFHKKNYDDAIKYAQKSLEINPSMLPAYLILGRLFSLKFDYDNSVKYFVQAEEKNLASPLLYEEWGNALVRLYRFTEAKEMYQKVLIENVESIEAQAGMAVCSAETGDFEKSHDLITFVEEKQPENVFMIEAKGLCEFANGNIKDAIDLFKKALTIDSNECLNYLRLAKCYEKLDRKDMVKDSYEKLIKFKPEFVNTYIEYAKYLVSIDDYKDAQRKLRKAERLSSDNQEVLNLLFYTSYILVKENVCEYNIKEAISIADRTQNFEYPALREDLEGLLRSIKQ